jgi:protein-arginine kinase activator protein McsA
MERLTEQTAADLAGNYARNRFRDEIANSTAHPDGYVCQNCGGVTDRLTQVPEFEYMGCDDCMEEALKQIERQQARKLVWGEGVHSGRLPEVA